MIKLSHTVFALPFALVAVVIIWKQNLVNVTWLNTIYIIAAFTGARSFSMAINRIADEKIDKENQRTANREIPAGVLNIAQVAFFAFMSAVTVWIFSWLLSPVAFYVSFPALILLAGYSYTKRFTWLCHLWLGAVIGMAPLAVYIALTQSLPGESIVLFVILSTYIAGFDILYSIQDMEFDKKMKLYSMPANLGISRALVISSLLHLITIVGVVYLGIMVNGGAVYYAGNIFTALLIAGEHFSIGWCEDIKKEKIPAAFLNYNSAVSIVFLAFTFLDVLL
jgi:4-hydroxybenzoate polyprenyltransferase